MHALRIVSIVRTLPVPAKAIPSALPSCPIAAHNVTTGQRAEPREP